MYLGYIQYHLPCMLPGLLRTQSQRQVHTRTRDTQSAECRRLLSLQKYVCHDRHRGRSDSVPGIPKKGLHHPKAKQQTEKLNHHLRVIINTA